MYWKTHLAYRTPQPVFFAKEQFLSQLPGTLLPPEAECAETALRGEPQAPSVAQPCLWPVSLGTKHGVLAA